MTKIVIGFGFLMVLKRQQCRFSFFTTTHFKRKGCKKLAPPSQLESVLVFLVLYDLNGFGVSSTFNDD